MKKIFLITVIFLSGITVTAEECKHSPNRRLGDNTNPNHNDNSKTPIKSSKGER